MKSPIHTFRVVTADNPSDWPGFIRSPNETQAMLDELLRTYRDPQRPIDDKTIELWGQIQALRWVLKLRDDLKTT